MSESKDTTPLQPQNQVNGAIAGSKVEHISRDWERPDFYVITPQQQNDFDTQIQYEFSEDSSIHNPNEAMGSPIKTSVSHGRYSSIIQFLNMDRESWIYPWMNDDVYKEFVSHQAASLNIFVILPIAAFIYLPLAATRTNLYNLPTFSPLWTANFVLQSVYMVLMLLYVIEKSLQYLVSRKNIQSYSTSLDMLTCFSSYVPVPTCILFMGQISAGILLLARVVKGQCPENSSVFETQGCNPVANAHSLPTDTILILYLHPMIIMGIMKECRLNEAVAAYMITIIFISVALALVDGAVDVYTVCYSILFIMCVFDSERNIRISFLARRSALQLLQQMLPEPVIRNLEAGKSVEPTTHDNVCCFLSDIVNFTELTLAVGSHGIREILNSVYEEMDTALDQSKGIWKVETAGDSYFCECGVVNTLDSMEANVNAILSFAVDVQKRVSKIKNPFTGESIQLRIGIHCGSCVAGLVGSPKVMPHFSLFGDLINITSRVETTGTAGMIHVSEAVALIGISDKMKELRRSANVRDWVFEKRGMVDLKGRGKMETWWFLGEARKSPRLTVAPRKSYTLDPSASIASFDSSSSSIQLVKMGYQGVATEPRFADEENNQVGSMDRPVGEHDVQLKDMERGLHQTETADFSIFSFMTSPLEAPKTPASAAFLSFTYDVRNISYTDQTIITNALFEIFDRIFNLHRLRVNPVTLKDFLRNIATYYKDVPYHNLHHAFCVTQFAAALYYSCIIDPLNKSKGGKAKNKDDVMLPSSLEYSMFASLIAVVSHDAGHDGFSNGFHVSSKSPLAKTFFKQSPQENHHISLCTSVLGMHGCDVFENWSDEYRLFVRNLISNSILATDMRLHDDVLGELTDLATKCKEEGGDCLTLLSIYAAASSYPTAGEAFSEELHYQLLSMARIILHAADISNAVRPFEISSTFVDKLGE